MGGHVGDDRLMDFLEGAASEPDRLHVEACPPCQVRIEDARAGLALARQAEVPEPSPLYWASFRRQMDRRLGAQRHRRLALWAPALAAAAALVLALGVFAPSHRPGTHAPDTLPPWSALPPAEEDEGLALLGALSAQVEELLPPGECSGIARCVSDLSDEESVALVDALREELGRESDL